MGSLVGAIVEEVDDADDEAEVGYYEQCIGATITAVHSDSESLWLHLSDGSLMEFTALTGGGFDIEIHPPGDTH